MLLAQKANEISEIMVKNGFDAMIVGPSSDLAYLTGLSPLQDERFKALFFLADQSFFYIAPELYYEETRAVLGSNAEIFTWSDAEGFCAAIEKAAKKFPLRRQRIAVNSSVSAADMLNMQAKLKADFFDGSDVMEHVRIIKTPNEVECLRQAARIADKAAGEIADFIHPGITERYIKQKLEELLYRYGGEGNSFDPIIASGPNSSRPHYNLDSRVILEGDPIVMDFGCMYHGYCSDMSRTVFVGSITDEQKKIYEIVYEANQKGEQAAKSGAAAEDVDIAARSVIRDHGYGQYFVNRTGHGIGVGVHEAPFMKEGNRQILQDGMAFSVEPGIYIPGRFGMRIEDIVVIVDGKGEILNHANRELQVIPC